MAKLQFTPPTYAVDNIQNRPTISVGDAIALKAAHDKTGADIKEYEISLLAELNGAEGAYKIGLLNPNLASLSVGDGIEEVRQIAINAQGGTIIPGSITNVTLDADIKVGSLAELYTANKLKVTDAINETYIRTEDLQQSLDATDSSLNSTVANVSILKFTPTTTGSSVAYALATPSTIDLTQPTARFMMTPNVTNTGACTLTTSGNIAKSIKKSSFDGGYVDVEAGDIPYGSPIEVTWNILNNCYLIPNGYKDSRVSGVSSFSNGLGFNSTTGKLQLAKNPQRIAGQTTVSESKSTVFNTTYSASLAGQYFDRFQRTCIVNIKSDVNPDYCMIVIMDLGKGLWSYIGSDGSFLAKQSHSFGSQSSLQVNASSKLGAGLLTGNTAHQYFFKVDFDDSTPNLPKVSINVASIGTPSYTLAFTMTAMFL